MLKIWNFRESEAVETDSIDLKAFKASGKFYDDADTLSKLFGIKVHPGLKAPASHGEGQPAEDAKDQSCVNFNKHRIDKNSMRVLFLSLPASPNIQTLK